MKQRQNYPIKNIKDTKKKLLKEALITTKILILTVLVFYSKPTHQQILLTKSVELKIEASDYNFVSASILSPVDPASVGEATFTVMNKPLQPGEYIYHAQSTVAPTTLYQSSTEYEDAAYVTGSWKYTFNRKSGVNSFSGRFVFFADPSPSGEGTETNLHVVKNCLAGEDPIIENILDGVNFDEILTQVDGFSMIDEDNWFFVLEKASKKFLDII